MSCSKNDENGPSLLNFHEKIVPENGYIEGIFYGSDRLTFGSGEMQWSCSGYYTAHVSFSDVGEIQQLNHIKNIPATGWRDSNIEIKIGHGYVVDYGDLSCYCRMFIKEYIDRGAVGAYRVQYQYWNPFTE